MHIITIIVMCITSKKEIWPLPTEYIVHKQNPVDLSDATLWGNHEIRYLYTDIKLNLNQKSFLDQNRSCCFSRYFTHKMPGSLLRCVKPFCLAGRHFPSRKHEMALQGNKKVKSSLANCFVLLKN